MKSFSVGHDMHKIVQFIQRAEELLQLEKRTDAGPGEAGFGWRLSACPSSPPTWMKAPSNYSGGMLRPEYNEA
jgi:hypothetical protein